MKKIEFEFCEKENKKLYIGNFLKNLDENSYKKINVKLEYFQEHTLLSFRNSKHTKLLDKKTELSEVRTKINKHWFRFLGKWVKNIFYIVHAFKKKSNETPPREIKTANKKVEDYFNK
ncbi:MAG: type II toxin-antitoxin system RelE/ParE family toxin [Parcubacteria group bacterium]|nr:type II toxin-antitoxin system RelE/ParE family toxin [Parcubacteria group bacterium]